MLVARLALLGFRIKVNDNAAVLSLLFAYKLKVEFGFFRKLNLEIAVTLNLKLVLRY